MQPPEQPLSDLDLARARSNTYTLLSRLYRDGLRRELLPYLEAVPELQAAVPDPLDAEEAAARHQHVFGFNVFPYESIFRDPSGLLGGEVAEAVDAFYRESGYAVSSDADHIAHELDFLSFLCGAETDALEDGQAHHVERARELQQRFLRTHLLPWLWPFALALQAVEDPLYAALGELTLEVAADHAAAGPEGGVPAIALPPLPDLLSDPGVGLKDIATFLVRPPLSGFYVSRDTVTRLARARAVPRGFGDRLQMLANLLRAAAQYDTTGPLLDDLVAIAVQAADGYAAQQAAYPELAGLVAPWRERSAETAALLGEMKRLAAGLRE